MPYLTKPLLLLSLSGLSCLGWSTTALAESPVERNVVVHPANTIDVGTLGDRHSSASALTGSEQLAESVSKTGNSLDLRSHPLPPTPVLLVQSPPAIPPGTLEPPRPIPPLPQTLPAPTPPAPLKPTQPLPSESVPALPLQVKLQRVEVLGSTVFSPEALAAVTNPFIGKSNTLEQLTAISIAITDLYTSKGYLTSGAFLPAQDISNGVVKIQVVEGNLERISVQGLTRLQTSYVRDRIATAGQPL